MARGGRRNAILLIVTFLVGGLSLSSQTTIWSENFNSYPNGRRSGTASGPSKSAWSSGYSTNLSVHMDELRGRNVGTSGISWTTDPINIYQYSSLTIKIDLRTNGGFESQDRVIAEYRIDGGSWSGLGSLYGSALNNLDQTYTFNLPSTGRTLRIRILVSNNSNSEYIYLDNIHVEGTLDLCPGELDFEFYDGNFSNTVENIPNSDYIGRGTVDHFNVNTLQNQEDPGDMDTYGIRYSGYIQIDEPGTYRFYSSSDDGSKVYINGTQVVNNDGDHGSQERNGDIKLSSGLHDIRVLFYENGGDATLGVHYSGPELSKRNLPFPKLYSDCTQPIADDSNSPPTITATGNQIFCPDTSNPAHSMAVVESVSITDPDSGTLDAVYIQITSNYDNAGDLLALTGTHPNITPNWSGPEGRLFLEGPATLAEFEAAILAVRFSTTATLSPGEKRDFSIVMNEANYLASTGHYYEYVPDLGIRWTEAKAAAELRKFYGLQGYLATILNQDESDLLGSQAPGAGWIGASDAGVEGQWRWVTGPEANTLFWTGLAEGAPVAGIFQHWNGGEPNNSGEEDYAHITDPSMGVIGSWNDLPDAGGDGVYKPKGYLVEYGGMPGDPPYPTLAVTTTLTVEDTPPTASAPAAVNVFCSADIPAVDIEVVTDEADNCDQAPTVTHISDVGDGGSNPEIITRTYRVTDRAGNTMDVQQTITVSPLAITGQPVDTTVLYGGDGHFSVATDGGDTYAWEVSINGDSSFVPINDGPAYSGTQTANLTLIAPVHAMNGHQYRVRVSRAGASCAALVSQGATLTLKARKVITNRKITHRVKKD